jgi:hypothetical protein
LAGTVDSPNLVYLDMNRVVCMLQGSPHSEKCRLRTPPNQGPHQCSMSPAAVPYQLTGPDPVLVHAYEKFAFESIYFTLKGHQDAKHGSALCFPRTLAKSDI